MELYEYVLEPLKNKYTKTPKLSIGISKADTLHQTTKESQQGKTSIKLSEQPHIVNASTFKAQNPFAIAKDTVIKKNPSNQMSNKISWMAILENQNELNQSNKASNANSTTSPTTSTVNINYSVWYNNEMKDKNKKILINNDSDFIPQVNPQSCHIITEAFESFLIYLPNNSDIEKKSPEELLDQLHDISTSAMFIELVSELKKLKLRDWKTQKQRATFWLNTFNFLILYTISYKKWSWKTEKDWNNFFRYVYYNIGGNEYSFEDMQYIWFNKIIFFSGRYTPSLHVKNNSVHAATSVNSDYIHLLSFGVFLPTGCFNPPNVCYDDNKSKDFDMLMLKNTTLYFFNFVNYDDISKILYLPMHVLNCFKNIWTKDFNLFEEVIGEKLSKVIKERTYRKYEKLELRWGLDFSKLK